MNTDHMPILDLKGSPIERGLCYGETQKQSIACSLESWLEDLGSFSYDSQCSSKVNPDDYLRLFFSQTKYISAIKRWAPDLLEEIKGIAEAASQPFEHVLGLNLMDEEWVFGLRQRINKPREKCTAFGLYNEESKTNFAGQNMDIGSWVDGRQVLLKISPGNHQPEAMLFSIAGSIGLNGINAAGLGITCNTLTQLNSSTSGLPVLFIVRSILAKQTMDEAESFLRSIPHASGQNYILSTADEIRCYECCGSSVVQYSPVEYGGNIFHTNHPLVSSDLNPLPQLNELSPSTVARLTSISGRLGSLNRASLDEVKMALSAHDDLENPVSRSTNDSGSSIGFTAGSSIYDFHNNCLHLAAGPPCETAFKTFTF